MEEPDLVRLLEINAYGVYVNLLTAGGDRKRRLLDRITHPQPGDLVVETSTIYLSPGSGDSNRLGRLKRIVYERYTTNDGEQILPEPVEEEHPDPRSGNRRIWYIETLDGREYRWHNADFVKVCESVQELTRSLFGPEEPEQADT